MRQFPQIALASFLFFVTAFSGRCDSGGGSLRSQLVIAAIVEGIGKHPGATSGYYQIYQLARYRVLAVCSGTYKQQDIVVDHLLVSGDELKSLTIGEKVYLTLSASKTIPMRFNEEGFRNPSENVETFYIGDKPSIIAPAQCKE